MSKELLDVSKVANEYGVWICAFIGVSLVLIQALLYTKLSFKTAKEVGLTKKQSWRGFRSGLISSIGPAMSVFVVVFGMAIIVGGPITWMRLAIIGGSGTELTAAQVGAQAYGVGLGSEGYNLDALATSWWTMAANGIGWLIVVSLFAHKMEKVRQKIGGGDSKWIKIFGVSATLGLFGFLSNQQILLGGGRVIAVFAGAITMVVLTKASDKALWLKEYALGFALILGMVFATLLD